MRQAMFQAARPTKSLWVAAGVSVLAFAITLAGALVGQVVLVSALKPVFEALGSSPWAHLLYLVLGFGPVILLMVLYSAIVEKRHLLRDVVSDATPVRNLVAGALVGSLLVLLPVAYGVSTGLLRLEWLPWSGGLVAALVASMLALTVQTFAEELVFRGWLLPSLVPRLGTVLAIGISSAVFAATHLLNGGFSPVNFLSLMLAGSVLGVLTVVTRSIWAAAAGHALWNWTQIAATSFGETPAQAGTAIANVAGVHGPLPAGGNVEAWGVFTLTAAGLMVACVAVLLSARARVRWRSAD